MFCGKCSYAGVKNRGLFLSLMKCLCKSGKTQKPPSLCGTGRQLKIQRHLQRPQPLQWQPCPDHLRACLCSYSPVAEVEGMFLRCVFLNLIFITDSKFSSPWLALKFINYSSDEDDPGGGLLSCVI